MHVHCTCWKQGKVKPWPYNFAVRFDVASGDLLPDSNCASADEYARRMQFLHLWQQTCCAHRGTILTNVEIKGRFNLDDFQFALAKLGWDHFPALYAELPPGNSGFTPASAAVQIIDELNTFLSLAEAFSKDPVRRIRLENYTEIIDALTTVCRASAATGNPIHW